jgi:hypothetical protein
MAEEREFHAQSPGYLFFTCSLQAMAPVVGPEKRPGESAVLSPSSLWGSVIRGICPCRINTPQVEPGSEERKVVTRRAEFDYSIGERKPKDSGEDDPSEGDLGAGNWLFPGKWFCHAQPED